jgi:hypothetical protein
LGYSVVSIFTDSFEWFPALQKYLLRSCNYKVLRFQLVYWRDNVLYTETHPKEPVQRWKTLGWFGGGPAAQLAKVRRPSLLAAVTCTAHVGLTHAYHFRWL